MSMNNLERAKYIILEDLTLNVPVGVGHAKYNYQKGDILNLRVNGRMAIELVGKGIIERLHEQVYVPMVDEGLKEMRGESMSPNEKREQLIEEFKKVKESRKDEGFKSFADMNIHIDQETYEEWRKHR